MAQTTTVMSGSRAAEWYPWLWAVNPAVGCLSGGLVKVVSLESRRGLDLTKFSLDRMKMEWFIFDGKRVCEVRTNCDGEIESIILDDRRRRQKMTELWHFIALAFRWHKFDNISNVQALASRNLNTQEITVYVRDGLGGPRPLFDKKSLGLLKILFNDMGREPVTD